MMFIQKRKLKAFGSWLIFISTVNIFAQSSKQSNFKDFINKFGEIHTYLEINTSEINESLYNQINIEEDSVFLPIIAPSVAIGRFKKNGYYILIMGTAAAVYVTLMIVYDEHGNIIDYTQISQPCGSGTDYLCVDYVLIFDKNIYNIRLEKYKNQEEKKVIQYNINKSGNIKKKIKNL